MSINLSCPDWEQRFFAGKSLIPSIPIDENQANRAGAIFGKLRLADVPGTPTMDEAGDEWFREIVRVMFGTYDRETKARIVRELFLLVAKKNSKTTYGALLMLTALLMNFRPSATLIMTAPVKDVADIAYEAARGAIELDPVLNKKLHVRDHIKTIIHRDTKAQLQIMTFDPATLTGQKVVAALIDELHVISKMSKAAKAIRQLRGGMLPFPEAFLAFITTQSEEAPQGVFKEELTKAREIRDGKRTGRMLPVLYEFPKDIQQGKGQPWKDPKLWHLVTPNLNRSITLDRLVEDFHAAENTSEEELRSWASQHLNVEIGLALMSNHWAGAEFWEQCAEPRINLDYIIEHCEVIEIGIDGGGLDDLLGLSVVGRFGDGEDHEAKTWLTWHHAWAHPTVLERRKEIAPALKDFEKEGSLTIVEKIGDDIDQLVDIVDQADKSGLLDKIGVDPIGIGDVLDALEAAKIDEEKIVGISQGWKLGGAIKTTERRLAKKTILHAGSTLMNWCVGNARIELRANSIIITKKASGTAKIDPLIAQLNANSLMALNPPAMKAKYQMVIV